MSNPGQKRGGFAGLLTELGLLPPEQDESKRGDIGDESAETEGQPVRIPVEPVRRRASGEQS